MIPSTSMMTNASSGGGGGGGSGEAASIDDRTVSKLNGTGGPATAAYTLDSDGNVYNHNLVNLETWRDSMTSADYQCRATLSSGSAVASGTIGSWELLSTDRTWEQVATGGEGNVQSVLLIEIRMAAVPNTVLDSATITLSATSSL